MSESINTLADLVPDSIDNALKNITDKPTQSIGNTLSDIWYIVFGGISQIAKKRELKYAYALREFEKELREKISEIPEKKLIEPDIHIVAQALESAKYSIEKDELRHMFANLISNSLNSDFTQLVHPIYVKIINNLTPYDAHTLYNLNQDKILDGLNFESIIHSLSILMQLGLVYFDPSTSDKDGNFLTIKDERTLEIDFGVSLDKFRNIRFKSDSYDSDADMFLATATSKMKNEFCSFILESVTITKLGRDFIKLCIDA